LRVVAVGIDPVHDEIALHDEQENPVLGGVEVTLHVKVALVKLDAAAFIVVEVTQRVHDLVRKSLCSNPRSQLADGVVVKCALGT
jgi:hypothetical protein